MGQVKSETMVAQMGAGILGPVLPTRFATNQDLLLEPFLLVFLGCVNSRRRPLAIDSRK